MWSTLLVVLLILAAIYCSTSVRVQVRAQKKALPDKAVSSPFSQALMELVGIAGGIYLSLVMLVSFLNLGIPERFPFMGIMLDPLALFSLFVAIIQPFVLYLIRR